MAQRIVVLVLAVALAGVAAQTITAVLESSTAYQVLRPCAWAYFSVQLPGTGSSFSTSTVTINNVVAIGSNPTPVFTAYTRVSATATAADLPTFVRYDKMTTGCISNCNVSPPCQSASNYLLIGVYNGLSDEVSFNVTVGAFSHFSLHAAQSISNSAPITVILNEMETYPFTFTVPAGVTNGFLRVILSAVAGNVTQDVFLTHGAASPYQCDTLQLINQFNGPMIPEADSPTPDYFDISPCEWVPAGATTYTFGLMVTDSSRPTQLTINATVLYAHTPSVGPGHYGTPNFLDMGYNVLTPGPADEVQVVVSNLRNMNNGDLHFGATGFTALETDYDTASSPFVQLNSMCTATAYTPLVCSNDYTCELIVRNCSRLNDSIYLTVDERSTDAGQYQHVPVSYTLSVYATTYTATPLTPNTPTPAVLPYGQTYQYFSVDITDADVAARARLLVSVYANPRYANSQHGAGGIMAQVSSFGLPGGLDATLDECGDYHRQCTFRPDTVNFCYVEVDHCFLSAGTWYIGVLAYNDGNVYPSRWAGTDVEFTITATLEPPVAVTNNTLLHSWVPNDQITYRHFVYTVVPTAVPNMLIVRAIPTHFTAQTYFYVQRGSLAGSPSDSMCFSQLDARVEDGYYGTYYSEASFHNVQYKNNLGSDSTHAQLGGPERTVQIMCPLTPGDYYIGVVAQDQGLTFGNENLPTIGVSVFVQQVPYPSAMTRQALTANVPASALLSNVLSFSFDTTGVPAGAAVRFRLDLTSVYYGRPLLSTVPNLAMTVTNSSEICGGINLFSYVCSTISGTPRPGVGPLFCHISIPASILSASNYTAVVTRADFPAGFDPEGPLDITVTAIVDLPEPVALSDAVPVVGQIEARPAVNVHVQQFAYTPPADLAPTDYVMIELYPGQSTGNDQHVPLTLFVAQDALAGPDPFYTQWPNNEHPPITAGYLGNQASAPTRLMLRACELANITTLNLGVGVVDSFAVQLFEDTGMIMYTIKVTRRSPTALTLGQPFADYLYPPVGTETLYNVYSVALPATLAPNAQLVVGLTSVDTAGTYHVVLSNSVDRAGAGWQMDLDAISYDMSVIDFIRVASPELRAGATYYIFVVPPQNNRGCDQVDTFVVSAVLDMPAMIELTTQPVSDSIVYTAGELPLQGHQDFNVSLPAPAPDRHYRFVVRASSIESGVILYVNVGEYATPMNNAQRCRTSAYLGTTPMCAVDVENYQQATMIYASVYASLDGQTVTVVHFDIAVMEVVPIVLSEGVPTTATLNLPGYLDAVDPLLALYFKFPIPSPYYQCGLNVTNLASTTITWGHTALGTIYPGAGGGGRVTTNGAVNTVGAGASIVTTVITANDFMNGVTPTNVLISVFVVGATTPSNVTVVLTIQNIVAAAATTGLTATLSVVNLQPQLLSTTLTQSMTYGTVVEFHAVGTSSFTVYMARSCRFYAAPSSNPANTELYSSVWDTNGDPSWAQFAFGGQDNVLSGTPGTGANLLVLIENAIGTVTTSLNPIPPTLLTLGSPAAFMELLDQQSRTFYVPAQAYSDSDYLIFEYGAGLLSSQYPPFRVTAGYLDPTAAGSFTSNASYVTGTAITSVPSFPLCAAPTNVFGNYYASVQVQTNAHAVVGVSARIVQATPLTAGGDGSITSYDLNWGLYVLRYTNIPADSMPNLFFGVPGAGYQYRLTSPAAGGCPAADWQTVSSNTTIDLKNGAWCPPSGVPYTLTLQLMVFSANTKVVIGVSYATPVLIAPNTLAVGVIPANFLAVQYRVTATADVNRLFNVMIDGGATLVVTAQRGQAPQVSCQSVASIVSGTVTGTGMVTVRCLDSPTFFIVHVARQSPSVVDTYFSINMMTTPAVTDLTDGSSFTNAVPLMPNQIQFVHLVKPATAPPVATQVTVTLSQVTCGTVVASVYLSVNTDIGNCPRSDSLGAVTVTPGSTIGNINFAILELPYTLINEQIYIEVKATDAYVNQSTYYNLTVKWAVPTITPIYLHEPVTVTEDDQDMIYSLELGVQDEWNSFVITSTSGLVLDFFDYTVEDWVAVTARAINPNNDHLFYFRAGPGSGTFVATIGRFTTGTADQVTPLASLPFVEETQAYHQLKNRLPRALAANTFVHDYLEPGQMAEFGASYPAEGVDSQLSYYFILYARLASSYETYPTFDIISGFTAESCTYLNAVLDPYCDPIDGTHAYLNMGVWLDPNTCRYPIILVSQHNTGASEFDLLYDMVAMPAAGATVDATTISPRITILPELTPTTPLYLESGLLQGGQVQKLYTFALGGGSGPRALEVLTSHTVAVDITIDGVPQLPLHYFAHGATSFLAKIPAGATRANIGIMPSTVYATGVDVQIFMRNVAPRVIPVTNDVPVTTGTTTETSTQLGSSPAKYYLTPNHRETCAYFSLDVPAYANLVSASYTATDVSGSLSTAFTIYGAVGYIPDGDSHDWTDSSAVSVQWMAVSGSPLPQNTYYFSVCYTGSAMAQEFLPMITFRALYYAYTVQPLPLGTTITSRTACGQTTILYNVSIPATLGQNAILEVFGENLNMDYYQTGDSTGYANALTLTATPYWSMELPGGLVTSFVVAVESTLSNGNDRPYIIRTRTNPAPTGYTPLTLNTPYTGQLGPGADPIQQFVVDLGDTSTYAAGSQLSFAASTVGGYQLSLKEQDPFNADDFGYCLTRYTYITVKVTAPFVTNVTFTITATVVTPVQLTEGYTGTLAMTFGTRAIYSFSQSQASTLTLTPAAGSLPVRLLVSTYGSACQPSFWAPALATPPNIYGHVDCRAGQPCIIARTVAGGQSSPMDDATTTMGYYQIELDDTYLGDSNTYTFSVAAHVGTGVAVAVGANGFCGDMGTRVSYFADDVSRSASAEATFENIYRSLACQVPQTPLALPMCMPLTKECNYSIYQYACEVNYRQIDASGFAMNPCGSFCSNIMANCLPLTFSTVNRYSHLTGVSVDQNFEFGMGWCEDPASTTCSGYTPPPPPPSAPPPPDAAGAVVDTEIPVGLIIGITVGLFALFAVIGIVLFIYLKRRRETMNKPIRSPSRPVSMNKGSATTTTPASPSSAKLLEPSSPPPAAPTSSEPSFVPDFDAA